MPASIRSLLLLITLLLTSSLTSWGCLESAPVYASHGPQGEERGGSGEAIAQEQTPEKAQLFEEDRTASSPEHKGAEALPPQRDVEVAEVEEEEPRSEKLVGWINLNEANAAELMLLPRVGPALSERIIAHREKRAFRRPSQLKQVKGIGATTYKKVSMHLRVEGATTLRRLNP